MRSGTLTLAASLFLLTSLNACLSAGEELDSAAGAARVRPTGNVTGIKVVLPDGFDREPTIAIGDLDYFEGQEDGALALAPGTYCIQVRDEASPDDPPMRTQRCGISVEAGKLTEVKLGLVHFEARAIAALAAQDTSDGISPTVHVFCPTTHPGQPLVSSFDVRRLTTDPGFKGWAVVDGVRLTGGPYVSSAWQGWRSSSVTTRPGADVAFPLDSSNRLVRFTFDLEAAELPTSPFAPVLVRKSDRTFAPATGEPLAFFAYPERTFEVSTGGDARAWGLSRPGSHVVRLGRLDVDDVTVTNTSGAQTIVKGKYTVSHVRYDAGKNAYVADGPALAFESPAHGTRTELDTGTGLWLHPGSYIVKVKFPAANADRSYEQVVRLQ